MNSSKKRKSPISEKQSATDILKKEKKSAFPFSQHIGRAHNVHWQLRCVSKKYMICSSFGAEKPPNIDSSS